MKGNIPKPSYNSKKLLSKIRQMPRRFNMHKRSAKSSPRRTPLIQNEHHDSSPGQQLNNPKLKTSYGAHSQPCCPTGLAGLIFRKPEGPRPTNFLTYKKGPER